MTPAVGRDRLYNAWCNMKQRCCNEARRDFPAYGGRGITVCDEWQRSFPAFMKWAMEHGYQDDLTLDRIETNGPYSPENCRWVTRKVQANNRRTNRFITLDGRTQSIKQWADEIGMEKSTLWRRFNAGWTTERALKEPVHTEKRKKGALS